MELWIGLACLTANPRSKDFRRFGDGKGAYVQIVAWAKDREHFEQRIKHSVDELDCILRDLDDVELLESKMERGDCSEEVLSMRDTALRQTEDIIYGTFHTWLESDVN